MIFKDKFLKNNVIVFLSSSLTGALNFLYQFSMIRKLSIVDYGILNSLLAVFTIISLPIGSITTMVAKFSSGYAATGECKKADFFIFKLFQHVLIASLIFIAFYFIYILKISAFLKLSSITEIYFIGGMLLLANLSAVSLGGIQGFEDFIWYSVSNISSALLKLILAVLFIGFGWRVLGALGAFLVAQCIGFIISVAPLKRSFLFIKEKPNFYLGLREKYKFIIPVLISSTAFAVLTNIDIILVKHFFQPLAAGVYSVAQIIGKIVLFFPLPISTVMLPRVSGLYMQNGDHGAILKKSLLYSGFLTALVILGYNLFPELALKIFTGKVEVEIIFLGRLFSVAMGFFSLLTVLFLYQLSVHKFKFIKWMIFFAVLQIIAISIFHKDLPMVLYIINFNAIILFFINLKLAMGKKEVAQ